MEERTKVRLILNKGLSSVVEWEDSSGNINRSIFPSSELVHENSEVFVENVEEGQSYGVDWEKFIHTQIGPKGIASLLRKHGIWTLKDYAENTAVVTSVFNEACSANFQHFKEAVRQGKDE